MTVTKMQTLVSFFLNRQVEFPLRWPGSVNIQKFRSVDTNTKEGDLVASEDTSNAAEKSMIEESTLLMKFCSISQDCMLTGHDAGRDAIEVDLLSDLTDEQCNIIVFPRSTFVLGRSGTGKTKVLTTKLIRNEKLHHRAVEIAYGPNHNANEISIEIKRPVLRQLFVTLSPGLCEEINHHVSCFKRYTISSTIHYIHRYIDFSVIIFVYI